MVGQELSFYYERCTQAEVTYNKSTEVHFSIVESLKH